MTTTDRLTLSLAQLEAFDPHPGGVGPTERRHNCPLPACAGKPVDRGHQALCANVDSGLYLCNRCGAKGKLTERWDDARSARDLRRARALRRYTLTPEPTAGTAASAPLLPELLERCQPVAGTPGESYLFGRGLGLDVATAADVRYVPRCYGAGVAFPMRDELGAVVAINVRHTDGRDGVTKTHSVGDRRLALFSTSGNDFPDVPLVVVEGPCDALALASCDVPAVALVATRAPRWLRRAAAFRRVYVALDADTEGDRASGELAAELTTFARSVERLRPPQGKDWNDCLLGDYPGLVTFLAGAGL